MPDSSNTLRVEGWYKPKIVDSSPLSNTFDKGSQNNRFSYADVDLYIILARKRDRFGIESSQGLWYVFP